MLKGKRSILSNIVISFIKQWSPVVCWIPLSCSCIAWKKMIYIKTYYITVSLATLADYIIRHQWESRKLHTETPAEVIGCSSGTWCLEGSLWRSWKSFHVFNSVFSPITGVPSVRTRDKMESRETPEISDAWAKMIKNGSIGEWFHLLIVNIPVFPLHGHVDSISINRSVGFPTLLKNKI